MATLDTGSELNWICQRVVDRLKLSVKTGNPYQVETFDGREFTSHTTATATWGLEGQGTTRVSRFRVAPKEAPFDVLFGRRLLDSKEVDFDGSKHPIQVLVQPGLVRSTYHSQA
jgi:hypothetical protein